MELESVKISVEELTRRCSAVEESMKEARKHVDDDLGPQQMHRFPEGLRGGLGDRYIVPIVVAIGPYHRASGDHLKKMEVVKRAAAAHLSNSWGNATLEQVYKAVLDVAGRAGRLYAADHDDLALQDPADLAEVMFFDACFLLHYMEVYLTEFERVKDGHIGHALSKLLFANRDYIENDIMLLENQIPWLVIETVLKSLEPYQQERYRKQVVGKFIASVGSGFRILEEQKPRPFVWVWGPDDEPEPHLLGLLRHYKTGGKAGSRPRWPPVQQIAVSSAIELAEIGIKLTASETDLFTDMHLRDSRGSLCGELSMAPLSLNDIRACWLVNMAAFEVATVSSYNDDPERTAVCSYLALFSMFMLQEGDVQELRAKGILHGHQTNAGMLAFFKNVVKHLPDDTGFLFAYTMARVQEYKQTRRVRTKVHKFMYNNFGTIVTVLTIVGTIIGIFQALLALNQGQKNDTPAGQYLPFLPA